MIKYNEAVYTDSDISLVKGAMISGDLQGKKGKSLDASEALGEILGLNADRCLLTTSCTDALEMAARLCNFNPGDEVLIPSYTFVTTASAFVNCGVGIRFVDNAWNSPFSMWQDYKNSLTPNVAAIIVVNYAGYHPDIEVIKSECDKRGIILIEDAAQSVGAYYKNRPYGTFGDLATFSFHETKNISCGEGGCLVVNNPKYLRDAEILLDKGTNRKDFVNGVVEKYTWISAGSSYLLSSLNAALLDSQLSRLCQITEYRRSLWKSYYNYFSKFNNSFNVSLPHYSEDININGHIFYLICEDLERFSSVMNRVGLECVTHYVALSNTPYALSNLQPDECLGARHLEKSLIRLPIHLNVSWRAILEKLEFARNIIEQDR